MAKQELENDRRYFCREETTGKRYSGMFHVNATDMKMRLFSFDEMILDEFDDLLVARLEDNRFVSLHQNVTIGPATIYSNVNKSKSSTTDVISNIVVIGEEAWQPDDTILRTEFSIGHANDLLLHSKRFNDIADAEFGAIPELTLFDLKAGGMTIKVWYPASGTMAFKRPTEIGVRYGIEFDEPRDLRTYISDVQCVVRFVSAALCHHFAPSEIHISKLSEVDFRAAVEASEGYHDHAVHYIWPVEKPDRSLWVGRAFAHVHDDKHLAEFVDCLRAWIERDSDWRAATTIMTGALKLQRTMSGERLLNACKWLEEIPGAASAIAVSDEDIAAIATVAAAEADRLGHGDYAPRISGVIRSQLKKESNTERFTRLHAAINARYGDQALPSDVIPHLSKAMQYRGKVAHGHYEPDNEVDYQAFAKSVYAMESFCYLLTIMELPMSDEGAKRAAGQQIAANYRHCAF